MTTAIDVEDVTIEYDGKKALQGLDWRVRAGESWAVVGPNGAGKTSLMSMLNGYKWPTEGTVRVLGQKFGECDLRELRTRIGMVSSFLETWVRGDEPVLELVVSGKYGATRLFRKISSSEKKRAISLLRVLGCEEHAGKRSKELSQGERQRVMIARRKAAGGLPKRSGVTRRSTILPAGSDPMPGLVHAGDSVDPAISKFYGDVSERLTAASLHLLFFALELNRVDDATIDRAMQTPELGHYRPWIEDIRKEKPYQLEDRVELLFHEKSVDRLHGAWNRLFDDTIASLRFRVSAGASLPSSRPSIYSRTATKRNARRRRRRWARRSRPICGRSR